MAVVNLQSQPIFAWIPPDTQTAYKITVEYSDGTIEDLTDVAIPFMFEDFVTESVGSFELNIDDPNEEYVTKFVGNEIVRYYKDYSDEATTLRFRGRVEKPSKRGNILNIKGRGEGKAMLDITVTKQFTDTECSIILSSIFGSYLPQFTLTNVTTSDTTLTVNWYQKPFFECVRDLCIATGFECYIDPTLDVHFFLSGSVNNETDAIVDDYNLLEVGDFTPDLQQIKNRVIVYGATQQGIQVIYTAEDTESIALYGVKEYIYNDENITDTTQAQEVAEFLLAELKDPPEVGEVRGVMLATIQAGENIRLSSQSDGIYPAYYLSKGWKDEFGSDSYDTTIYINKEPRKVSHILRDRVANENRRQDTSSNPEEMRFSYPFLFKTSTGSHTNTEITQGILKPTSTTGTWVSENLVLDSNITEAYLILNGEVLTDVRVSVSGNTGLTYDILTNRTKLTLTKSVGKNIRVKVEFLSANPQVSSMSVLYNKE